MQASGIRGNQAGRGSAGFSLIEALMAIAVLTIGVLAVARMIPVAIRTDFGSRTDSTAVFVAKRELEQMLAQPFLTNTFTDAADGAGNTATVRLACTCSTVPCGPPTATPAGNAGALLSANGDIDFSQPQTAAALIGYRRTYATPTATGNIVKINQGPYEVRWHVTCSVYQTGASLNSIVVAARPTGNLPGMIPVQVNLRAVKMK